MKPRRAIGLAKPDGRKTNRPAWPFHCIKTPMHPPSSDPVSRRTALRGSAAALAAIAAARALAPRGAWAQSPGPEVPRAALGFIALTDAAPLIVAKERGLFAKHGMPDVTVVRQGSWAGTRNALLAGGAADGIDGAHVLSTAPYLMSAAAAPPGSPALPLQTLARLNLNGQGISLSNAIRQARVALDSTALRPLFQARPGTKVASTLRGGNHDLWLRYWLAAGGIDPDRDVQLIAMPPPQMVAAVKAGVMDAFCAGEPWNERFAHEGLGYTACTSGQIWRDHPEKAFVMRADWVARHPRAAVALTAAIIEAQQWSDQTENRPALAQLLSQRQWCNVPVSDIAPRLQGTIAYGDGRVETDAPHRVKFWANHASYPFQSHELWFITELMRWGLLPPDFNAKAAIAAVNREDIWRLAAVQAEVAGADIPAGLSRGPETFFDGKVFDPAAPARYLAGLRIRRQRT